MIPFFRTPLKKPGVPLTIRSKLAALDNGRRAPASDRWNHTSRNRAYIKSFDSSRGVWELAKSHSFRSQDSLVCGLAPGWHFLHRWLGHWIHTAGMKNGTEDQNKGFLTGDISLNGVSILSTYWRYILTNVTRQTDLTTLHGANNLRSEMLVAIK